MRVSMSVKSIHGLWLGLVVCLVISGCTTIKETASELKTSIGHLFGMSDENQTAEELAMEGMDYYADGEYKKAVERFQQLKDIYPFSRYAMLAELKLGDAHYRLEQYDDAIFAYEEFEKLHPRNEAIPYVIYQIGRCHFDRMTTPDRDQNAARKALEAFQRLIKQYPRDTYARSAADHVVACQKSLSGHAFGIGVFYYKSKHYKAALSRFRSVVTEYPDVGYHQGALEYIVRSEKKLAEETVPDPEAPDAPARELPGSG
jgi:outer membrane protein assembly factor BamD